MIIILAVATFVSTLLGGLIAIRFRDKLHLVLGASAGAVLGVAFFDLIPESLELGGEFFSASTVQAITAGGFFFYLLLDRLVFLHSHNHLHEDEGNPASASQTARGILGAGSLAIHSFIDGAAIGLAFQVSAPVGAIVAAAVLVHDFSDGINTVNLILKNQGGKKQALKWLVLDALAPVAGAVSTLFYSLPASTLTIILALFAGFFLYIGASDLIPESHHAHPKFLTTAMTLIGAAVLYLAIHLTNL